MRPCGLSQAYAYDTPANFILQGGKSFFGDFFAIPSLASCIFGSERAFYLSTACKTPVHPAKKGPAGCRQGLFLCSLTDGVWRRAFFRWRKRHFGLRGAPLSHRSRGQRHYWMALLSTTSWSLAAKSSRLIAPRSSPARVRTETVLFSISRSPTTII